MAYLAVWIVGVIALTIITQMVFRTVDPAEFGWGDKGVPWWHWVPAILVWPVTVPWALGRAMYRMASGKRSKIRLRDGTTLSSDDGASDDDDDDDGEMIPVGAK